MRAASRLHPLAALLLVSIAAVPFASAERITADRIDPDRAGPFAPEPSFPSAAPDDGLGGEAPLRLVRRLDEDPLSDPLLRLAGDAASRLSWGPSPPAFDGDAPGGLTVLYDASLPAGRAGFALPRPADDGDTFTAAAAFVIRADGFVADPNGFFQISWGLWNDATTGLERTGSPAGTSDTFELVEFDWFPNVSSIFGGPFLSPTVFGVPDLDDPALPFDGAFANVALVFDVEAALPFDVPLLAVIEHRPDAGAMTIEVLEIAGRGRALPVNGAVATLPLGGLDPRAYEVDTVGLTLWHDGFGGANPAVRAEVVFHALLVEPGASLRPESLLELLEEDEDDGGGGHGGAHGGHGDE